MVAIYIYAIEYRGETKYCLWYEADTNDRFVTEDGKIKVFSTMEQVYEYGKQRNINICNEAVWLNITEVTKFIDILEMWNVASDISNSLFSSIWIDSKCREITQIYKKILWGSNLEPLTPAGEYFIPDFSEKEKRILNRICKFAQSYIKTELCF